MIESFYLFILSYRGGDSNDSKSLFAEGAFQDHSFPKASTSFEELSSYIETLADEHMTTHVFDELWELYQTKYQ
ncbi:YozE family protein [Ureibacillus sp. GCM10028918]|uniref:YozE family protein n=1 Tax=Ureibacillus sp. GCM10028918 TaxID=3273429 RepID=UPI00361825DD